MVGTALRENAQPLPSPVDAEDSLDEGPGALVLESDLLLGQDLEFEEEEEEEEGDGSSDQLLGFERDSEGEFGDFPGPSPSGGGEVRRELDAPLADLSSPLHHCAEVELGARAKGGLNRTVEESLVKSKRPFCNLVPLRSPCLRRVYFLSGRKVRAGTWSWHFMPSLLTCSLSPFCVRFWPLPESSHRTLTCAPPPSPAPCESLREPT